MKMIVDAIISALKFLLMLIPIIVIGIVLAELLVVELKLVRGLGFFDVADNRNTVFV